MGSDGRLLDRAAAAHGVELEYTDVFGHTHHAQDEVTRTLLDALGFPAATDQEIERSWEAERKANAARVIDPVIVVRADDHAAIQIRIPKMVAGKVMAGATIKLEIEWEGGELEHHWHWLPELGNWLPALSPWDASHETQEVAAERQLRPGLLGSSGRRSRRSVATFSTMRAKTEKSPCVPVVLSYR